MLGSKRVLLRLRHARSLVTAVSQRPGLRPNGAPAMDSRSHRVKKVISRFSPTKKTVSLLSAEQLRLQNKHREELESNKAESLQEIVEHIEWRGIVYTQTPEKIAKLLADPKQDLTSLSYRQIAVLLSSFGNACQSVATLRKSALMSQALQALRERGVSLQLLSRNVVLSARIDNGETVNVIEELQQWELENLIPNEETYAQLSRVYAHAANTQGILDIINHLRSNEMPVLELVIESLVYSVAKGGHYEQADKFVEKFTASANETMLRTAIARAAVARGEFSAAVKAIAAIPMGPKLNQISNNKMVLEVLFDMLDAGEADAIERLSAYLVMAPEGTTLSEYHVNPSVLARARRACAEGKLDVALKLYGLLHPKFKNSFFEISLLDSLSNRMRNESITLDDVFSLAERMEKMGLLKDHNLFLLEKSANTPRTYEVFSTVMSRGHIERCLVEKPTLRKSLARRLSEKLTKSNLNKDQRAQILADIATVLFSYDAERAIPDIMADYSIIYVLSGRDVDLAIPALNMIQHPHIRKEFATALVQQLLRKGDPLAEEKLNKLLSSGAVQSINLSRIQKQVSGLVLNREKKEGEADRKQLTLAAQLFALYFPAESANAKSKSTVAVKYLISLLQSELLPVGRTRLLFSFLEKEPRVRLSSDDIITGKKAFQESGQKEKGELLEKLRKKSQTYARWLSSSIEELEEELTHIRDKPDIKPGVAAAIQEIILKKVSAEKPINYQQVERQLQLIKEASAPVPSRVSDAAKQMLSSALASALTERKLDVVKNLWASRVGTPSVENTLTYIALLFLNGRKEEADAVCEDLRSTAQTITAPSLQTVGDRLGDEWDIEQMRQLSHYLQGKFNLGPQQLLRIIACVRLRQLERLIAAGKLEEALQLVVEQTVESNSAFGQFQLSAAAVRAENMSVLKGVFDVVKRAHGKEVAFLDLAMVLLEEKRTDRALKLLDTPQLKISPGKLEYFIRRAVDNNRPDVLRGLFTGLCKDDKASTLGLNRLLVQLCRMYYKMNDFSALDSLQEQIERSSFPLEQEIRIMFENLRRRKLENGTQ